MIGFALEPENAYRLITCIVDCSLLDAQAQDHFIAEKETNGRE